MADTVLGILPSAPLVVAFIEPPWFGGSGRGSVDLPQTYEIRGHVRQRTLVDDETVDVPLANARVRLYYRPTGVLIGATRAAEDGSYVFPQLPNLAQAYFAIAFDPEGAPVQNAVVFDRLSSSTA